MSDQIVVALITTFGSIMVAIITNRATKHREGKEANETLEMERLKAKLKKLKKENDELKNKETKTEDD
ncbi:MULTISPECIES: hypothetical protein [Liquorilactobacillus]|uniref:hypothetical protein n=1 Tax=Liquorilactobacillus TaxID=2767888 RepID=UPI0039ED5A77